MITRTIYWRDDYNNTIQVSVALLDNRWEPQAECTEILGPFDDPPTAVGRARARCFDLLPRGVQDELI